MLRTEGGNQFDVGYMLPARPGSAEARGLLKPDARVMPPGGHLALFAAPALRASGQFQISSLASISWIARSIHMIWIELQHEGIRMMEIRASRWMSERPVGKNAISSSITADSPSRKRVSFALAANILVE